MTAQAPFAACTLTNLPPEILAEIVSHYPSSFPLFSAIVRQEHIPSHKERCQILRSLSQTCSVLRRICLPILWERFEVSRPNFQTIYTKSELATVIFPCIKSVHISMKFWTKNDMESIFHFVEFLCALPNLIGLQIYHGLLWDVAPILSYAFGNVSLPTVTALSVPDSLDGILPSFPNLKMLSGPALTPRNRLLLAVAKTQFPHLEAIAGIRTRHLAHDDARQFIGNLTRDFPNLRALSMSHSVSLEHGDIVFAGLRSFAQLSELEFLFKDEGHSLALDALISGGKGVLRTSRSPKAKFLRVWTYDTTIGPCLIHNEKC
ncbi:hypothetical protein C8R45DRAFT_998066 [Mycena sanguinolenta]|nr:hypothetical protein C8R45DRAFT_998066 [Mycena sanguinolenta]